MDQVPISLASFPSDTMMSLTTLVPLYQLMKINLGVPHLLMKITIMYQVEVIMEIVAQNAHCQMINVMQINLNARQVFAFTAITITVVVHAY